MADHQATNIETTIDRQQSLQRLNAWIASRAPSNPHGFTAAQLYNMAPAMMLYHQNTGRIANDTFPSMWTDQICNDFLGTVRGIYPTNDVLPIWIPGHPSSRPVFQIGIVKRQEQIPPVFNDIVSGILFRDQFAKRAGKPVYVHLGLPFVKNKLAYLNTITPFDHESIRLPDKVIDYTANDEATRDDAIIAEQNRVDSNFIGRAATLNARYLAFHAAASAYAVTMDDQAVALRQINYTMTPVPFVPSDLLGAQMLRLSLEDHQRQIHEMYTAYNEAYVRKMQGG